jgi:hypothetical protein
MSLIDALPIKEFLRVALNPTHTSVPCGCQMLCKYKSPRWDRTIKVDRKHYLSVFAPHARFNGGVSGSAGCLARSYNASACNEVLQFRLTHFLCEMWF